MKEQYKNFMQGSFWFQKEDNIYTVGLTEDALEDFDEISGLELPPEGEIVEAEGVCGSLETDEGPVDLYAPVSGTISEVNSTIVEDPSLIQDDPYDAWLFKIESEDEFEEEDEEDLDDEDEDDEDEDDEEDDDYEEEEEED